MKKMNNKLLAVFFLLVLGLGMMILRDYSRKKTLSAILPPEDNLVMVSDNNYTNGLVLAEESIGVNDLSPDNVTLASEDYRLEQVNIGGDLSIEIANRNSDDPPQVSEIRSEVVTDKDSDEIKVILYWKSNKPVISQVEYGRSGEDMGEEVKEDDYSYAHAIVLPELDASSVYNYIIHVQDSQGNQAESERFVFYTGAPRVSLLDVLEGAAAKAFGWAMRN